MLKLNQASWSSLRKIHRAFESVRVVLSLRFKGGTESSVEFIRLSIIKIETARFAHFGRNIRETIVVTREAQNADKPTSRWEGACLVFIFCFTSAEDARTAITSIATTRLNDRSVSWKRIWGVIATSRTFSRRWQSYAKHPYRRCFIGIVYNRAVTCFWTNDTPGRNCQ